jgi:cell division protein FtsQ
MFGLALAGAIWGWPLVRDAARRHPYFALHEVVVRGRRRLPAARIRAAAGIVPGMSIWDVDCGRAESRLRDEPWVRSARVRRELPHRVVIQVREERPVAILATGESPRTLYYVGAHGHIFAPVAAGDPRDFPYFTGLGAADLGGGAVIGPRAVRRALALMRLLARDGKGLGTISEIHIDPTRGLTVLPVRPALAIEVGWGDFEAKLGRLPPVLAMWAGREANIASVSLLFDDEVVVRTRASRPARPPASAARG